jgi:hypothetical protein
LSPAELAAIANAFEKNPKRLARGLRKRRRREDCLLPSVPPTL